jgi:hypothetical protein
MKRIDRLGWSDALVLDAFGVRIGLRSDSSSLLRRAAERWTAVGARVMTVEETGSAEVVVEGLMSLHSGARDVTATARPALTFYDGATRVIHSADREAVLDALDSTLRIGVADLSPTRLFVHAGVVAYRGEAILVAGGTLAGKTTLVRALLERGATYYSDDAALIDDDGRVHPFAKPLAVRETPESRQRSVTAESLGAVVGREPLRAGVVAVTRYREGALWRPAALDGGAATLAMIPHTGGVQGRPARALAMLGHLLRGATALRGIRGDAGACADQLLRTVERRAETGRCGMAA